MRCFIGEFGICREIKGAEQFLMDIGMSCFRNNLTAFLYAFRENGWDGMDYELGTNMPPSRIRIPPSKNILMKTVFELIKNYESLKGNAI